MSANAAALVAAMSPGQRRLTVVLYAFNVTGVTRFDLGLTTPHGLSDKGVECGRLLVQSDPQLAALFHQVLGEESR